MAKHYSASNYNIPEAARKILGALNYYDLEPIVDRLAEEKGLKPSFQFKSFKSGDVEISIATAAHGKPITVTIIKSLDDGTREEMLFHYDPLKQVLLSAMQTEVH